MLHMNSNILDKLPIQNRHVTIGHSNVAGDSDVPLCRPNHCTLIGKISCSVLINILANNLMRNMFYWQMCLQILLSPKVRLINT